MTDKREQAVYELMLLYTDFRCTCDEVVRETEIYQAKGHYHHCMLWLVSHAIERSFMYSDGYRLVNGKMVKPQSSNSLSEKSIR